MKLTKEQLIAELNNIILCLENSDTYQGNLNYDAFDDSCGKDEFIVTGAYRFGNSEGQGFMKIIS